MSFTDEEIKTLKKELNRTDYGEVVSIQMPADDLRQIIARLEAAETLLERILASDNFWSTFCEAKVWRKAAGK